MIIRDFKGIQVIIFKSKIVNLLQFVNFQTVANGLVVGK